MDVLKILKGGIAEMAKQPMQLGGDWTDFVEGVKRVRRDPQGHQFTDNDRYRSISSDQKALWKKTLEDYRNEKELCLEYQIKKRRSCCPFGYHQLLNLFPSDDLLSFRVRSSLLQLDGTRDLSQFQ